MDRIGELSIVKADGSSERFSESKLQRCLQQVLRGSAYDVKLAEPLARAVAMHVSGTRSTRPPASEYVFRCLLTVLKETGLDDAADALANHRRQRAAHRRRVRILVSSRTKRALLGWSKRAVVQSLMQQHGLQRPVARLLAGEIETRVFALGYRVVRAPLVTELTRNELMAWGLADEPALAVGSSGASPAPEPARWPPREN